ncbi:hypothetical protein [Streptomyces broussonetiae]|uniref:Uncharacterized protein n=1 Tax=Streptomyces broussonetiae TaxID=2686304 RepID=A0A6I6N1A0_9ACTN|nr:hypothetical protein [Streptomyces broussonetiae]QHA02605.1 hypothetical protein GQF42_04255 [Streptomyces broussonetiae]
MSALRERSALSQLAPGEQLLGYGNVVPAKSAKGIGIATSLANQLVNNIGAQSAGAGSIAAGMPRTSGALLLRVTDQRVGLVKPLDGTPVWEVPRAWVTRVERRPRTQLMARFRLHFADGSWLAFLTMRRRTLEQFRSLIG